MAAVEPRPNSDPASDPYPWPAPAGNPLGLHPAFRHARTKSPVCPVELGDGGQAWAATTHASVRRVLRDEAVFSRAAAVDAYGTAPTAGTLLGMDGAEHDALRGILQREFTPAAVGRWRTIIEDATAELLDEMAREGSPADLVTLFGTPLALGNITAILGIPKEDRAQFHALGDQYLAADAPEAAMAAMEQMVAYLGDLLAERRRNPAGDLMSVIADGFGTVEIRTLLILAASVITAGWETTAATFNAGVYQLLTTAVDGTATTVYRHLCAHPADIPAAVEELLRVTPVSTTGALPRRTTRPVELEGTLLPEGALVYPAQDSGNLDETVFPEPAAFRLDRGEPAQHLAFGHGPHLCLGANLARLELRIGFELLTTRFPDLRLAVAAGEIPWSTGAIRGPQKLLVAWGPRSQRT